MPAGDPVTPVASAGPGGGAGGSRALGLLRAAVAAERWDRPFLLLGRGPAPEAAAREAARAVLCPGRPAGSGEACGACGSCHRFARDLHPDFHLLAASKGRVSIGVDAVEELQQRLSMRPLEGRATVALVPGAGDLTAQAQNALLKTLEEPPPRTALLLTADAPRALLDTVRSRCAALRFPAPSRAALRGEALRLGGGPAAGDLLEAAAAGDPGALAEAAAEGLAEAAPAIARAFAPSPRGGGPGPRDPLEGIEAGAAWVRGKGGTLEEQRVRLRLALRLLLSLHAGGGGGGEAAAPFRSLRPRARDARLAALGLARERVERNVDPVGILESLAVACARADAGRAGGA